MQAGLRVAEVPIEFVERELGDSKMDQRIVSEALWRVTVWGVQDKTQKAKRLLAGIIGWAGVLLAVAVLVILGSAVMRRAGFAAARSLRPVQADGVTVMPGQASAQQVGREVGDAGLVFLAGAMIAIPGLITSTLGLLLLIPPLRTFVRRTISRSVRRRATAAGVVFQQTTTTVTGTVVRDDEVRPVRGEILQGEIVRDDDPPTS